MKNRLFILIILSIVGGISLSMMTGEKEFMKIYQESLETLSSRKGSFSHEIGHSMGIRGHIKDSGEITSYDKHRNVTGREVQEVVKTSIQIANNAKEQVVKLHLRGFYTEKNKKNFPPKIIK